jgi:hypothetical protein
MRLAVPIAVALSTCPFWYGLDGAARFPDRIASECFIMRVYTDDAGNEVIQFFREYGGMHSHAKMMPAPSGVDYAARTELGRMPWHTDLDIGCGPSSTRYMPRILGAPVRFVHLYDFRAHSRKHGVDGEPSDQLLEYWNAFAAAMTASQRDLSYAYWMTDREFASQFIATPVTNLGSSLRRELVASPIGFGNGSTSFLEVSGVYRPGIVWLAVRAVLAIMFLVSSVYALAMVRAAMSAGWRNPPWCPRCRYSLTPAMPHCPECGTPIRWPETA